MFATRIRNEKKNQKIETMKMKGKITNIDILDKQDHHLA